MPTPIEPGFRPAYFQLHWVGKRGAWRSVAGAVVLGLLVFVIAPLVLGLVFAAALAGAGWSVGEITEAMDPTTKVTPMGLLFVVVVLAAAIPLTWLVSWAFHGLKPRWLTSVAPAMRVRYLLVCLGLSVIALLATVLVGAILPSAGTNTEMSGPLNDFTNETRNYLLIVLFLVPFQAAGEEYAFRGYLTQAFGGLFSSPRVAQAVAVLGPATLFACAHGLGQSVPIFFDRFAFGVVAGILVIVTGGLEAAIAMHVLNNWLAFGVAIAFGDMTSALNPTGGSWWMIISTLTQSLVYLGLAVWAAKRMGLARTGPPAGVAQELVASARSV